MTRFYYLKGKSKWFRPNKLNDWGKWEHTLYLDDESLTVFKGIMEGSEKVVGVRNRLQKDDDGYFVRLGRQANKTIKGKVIGFSPPIVLDREGKPLRNINVGNGSDITSKIEVYEYKLPFPQLGKSMGSALRWESTRVDNLVPFNERTDFTKPEEDQIEGMAEVEPQPKF